MASSSQPRVSNVILKAKERRTAQKTEARKGSGGPEKAATQK
jgi:hypothetical protein